MSSYLIDEKKNFIESLNIIKKTYDVTITFTGTNTSYFYEMNINNVSDFISDLQSGKLIYGNMVSRSIGFSGRDDLYTEYISALTNIYPKIFALFGLAYRFDTEIFTIDSSAEWYTVKTTVTATSLTPVFSFNTTEELQGDLNLTGYKINLYLQS